MKTRESTTIHLRIDYGVKEEAQLIADEIGLSLSGLVTAFLKQLIRTRGVKFIANDKSNPYMEAVMRQARRDMNKYKIDPMNIDDVFYN